MTMTSHAIKTYNILKGKFTEQEAQDILDYFETLPKEGLATKEDILRLESDMSKFEVRLIKWVVGTGIGTVTAILGILFAVLRYLR